MSAKQKILHALSECFVVDRGLQKRAGNIVRETKIETFLQKNGVYLDVGAGKCHVAERILKDKYIAGEPLKKYTAIDNADHPTKKTLKRLRQFEKKINQRVFTFQNAGAEKIPFPNKSFDGVIFLFVLHHTPKKFLDIIFSETKRVLKNNGLMFIAEDIVENEKQKTITEKNDRKMNWENKHAEHHYKSNTEWQKYFQNNGWKIMNTKWFHSRQGSAVINHAFYVIKKT